MIQRIQSIFLFFSAIAIMLLFFFPLLSIGNAQDGATLFIGAVKVNASGKVLLSAWPLLTLAIIILWINLLSIFFYKRRMFQMRITIYNIILMAGLILLGFYYSWQGQSRIDGEISLGFFSIMPVISMIFSYLAWRNIRRDYLMLKAVNRIR